MRIKVRTIEMPKCNPDFLALVLSRKMNSAFQLNLDLLSRNHVPGDEICTFPVIGHQMGVIAVGRESAGDPLEIEDFLLSGVQVRVTDFFKIRHNGPALSNLWLPQSGSQALYDEYTPWWKTPQIRWPCRMELRKAFARNLRISRATAGYSQEELADLAQLDRTYISALERCVYSASLDTVERIANALKVDPADLVRHPDKKLARRKTRGVRG